MNKKAYRAAFLVWWINLITIINCETDCSNKECKQYEKCVMVNNTATCTCSYTCDDEDFAPVCASNGQTFSSKCLMELIACAYNDHNMTVIEEGTCSACADVKCEDYMECIVPPNGTASCSCDYKCPFTQDPVCGTDRITYANECELRYMSCWEDGSILPFYKARCSDCEYDCDASYSPVCGSDFFTYDNECYLNQSACTQLEYDLHKLYDGVCVKCIDHYCTNNSKCRVIDDVPQCVCDFPCPLNAEKACGTDGDTYFSKCDLESWACDNNKPYLYTAYTGKCIEEPTCEKILCPDYRECDTKIASVPVCTCEHTCSEKEEPVCSSDGHIYFNECTLSAYQCIGWTKSVKRNMTLCQACDGFKCDNGRRCMVQKGAPTCVCDYPCPFHTDPVCDSSGRTHANLCNFEFSTCSTGEVLNYTIGACNATCDLECEDDRLCEISQQNGKPICTCNYVCNTTDPVCATNGHTFNSKCDLTAYKCMSWTDADLASPGPCDKCVGVKCDDFKRCQVVDGKPVCTCDFPCPVRANLICGDDNNTYENECDLDATNCFDGTNVTIVKQGDCSQCGDKKCAIFEKCVRRNDTDVCTCDYNCNDAPPSLICGSNGEKYNSHCAWQKANCESEEDIFEVLCNVTCDDVVCPSYERCTIKNGETSCGCDFDCPFEGDPICSSNGETIQNKCVFDKIRCKYDRDLTIQYKGNCTTCEETECEGYRKCSMVDGKPICTCKFNCSNEKGDETAVCGSDMVTYSSRCVLEKTSCDKNPLIHIVSSTPCESCEGVVCTDHKRCKINMKGKAVCSCNFDCPKNYSPVCDSEGDTNYNECTFYQLACELEDELEILYTGECESCVDKVCAEHEKCSLVNYRAVCSCDYSCDDAKPAKLCASDGITYNSECEWHKANCLSSRRITVVRNDSCETCDEKVCPGFQRCSVVAGRALCSCNFDCKSDYRPVCDSEGDTQANECTFERMACDYDDDLSILYYWECESCEEKVCSKYEQCKMVDFKAKCTCDYTCQNSARPVCGSDGRTYKNTCHMERESCVENVTINAVRNAACDTCERKECENDSKCIVNVATGVAECTCDFQCDYEYDGEVCGSDGTTYVSKCELQRASCNNGGNITMLHEWECETCKGKICDPNEECDVRKGRAYCVCGYDCPPDTQQVCAFSERSTVPRTYSNVCTMRKAACRAAETFTIVKQGPCETCEDHKCPEKSTCEITSQGVASCDCGFQCPQELSPVCGSDGVTYNNECHLQKEDCKLRPRRLYIVKETACETCDNIKCDGYQRCLVQDGDSACTCDFHCPDEQDILCGTDGEIYFNECQLNKTNCNKDGRTKIANKGPCISPTCNNIVCENFEECRLFDDVPTCTCDFQCDDSQHLLCGTDTNTYFNTCNLRKINCKERRNISELYKGPCRVSRASILRQTTILVSMVLLTMVLWT